MQFGFTISLMEISDSFSTKFHKAQKKKHSLSNNNNNKKNPKTHTQKNLLGNLYARKMENSGLSLGLSEGSNPVFSHGPGLPRCFPSSSLRRCKKVRGTGTIRK